MTVDHLENTSKSVSTVMSRSLLTVSADESVLMAFELASRAEVHHLPVMGPDGTCLGVVGTDTLRALSIGPLGERRPSVSELVDQSRPRVSSNDSLRDAAALMISEGTDVVLVVDDLHLVGLLTWRDIVRWVAGMARPDHATAQSHPVLFSLDPVIELPDHH